MDSLNDVQKLIEEKFVCRRCQECCKKPGFVYLQKNEEERIAKFLNQDPTAFVNDYCELVDRRRLTLKKNLDESCVFLSQEGCSIHAVKPRQCLEFPVKWRTDKSFEYCEGLKEVIGGKSSVHG